MQPRSVKILAAVQRVIDVLRCGICTLLCACLLCACLLCVGLCAGGFTSVGSISSSAYAASTDVPEELSVSIADTSLGFAGVAVCNATVSPSTIEVGIDCGMADMCGLDPCLCGAVDAWGACACNGTTNLEPECSYELLGNGGVWTLPFGDGVLLIAKPFTFSSCDSVLSCTASLKNYEDVTVSAAVERGVFSAVDAVCIGLICIGVAVVYVCVRRGTKKEVDGDRG